MLLTCYQHDIHFGSSNFGRSVFRHTLGSFLDLERHSPCPLLVPSRSSLRTRALASSRLTMVAMMFLHMSRRIRISRAVVREMQSNMTLSMTTARGNTTPPMSLFQGGGGGGGGGGKGGGYQPYGKGGGKGW